MQRRARFDLQRGATAHGTDEVLHRTRHGGQVIFVNGLASIPAIDGDGERYAADFGDTSRTEVVTVMPLAAYL